MSASIEQIHFRILTIRMRRVILDADLAELYGVSTKQLNQQLRRNRERFPEDFVFQISAEEKAEVVTNCDHLQRLKFSSALPHAFTEHGALMVANFIKTNRATQTSIAIVRAFVRLRELLISHRDLAVKLQNLERKYDSQFKIVFDAIRQLMAPAMKPNSRIGFEKPD
jgi:hypothetical protein